MIDPIYLYMGLGTLILLSFILIIVHINESEKRIMERMEQFESWTFEALYAIHPGIIAPDPIIEEKSIEPASIYSPKLDPYGEFRGEHSDWTD